MEVRGPGRSASELYAFLLRFHASPDAQHLSVAALRQQILALVEAATADLQARGVPPGECQEARFAWVAFADEMVLRAGASGREEWQREPLQLQLFRTNQAGNEFYDHLARLRPEQAAAREVYFYCLALGFEGQYAGHEAERRALIAQQYEWLRVAGRALDVSREALLAPAAYEVAIRLPEASAHRVWPWLLGMAGGVLLLWGTLWLILRQAAASVPLPLGS